MIYTINSISQYGNIFAGTTKRFFSKKITNNKTNREFFFENINRPIEKAVFANQVHGNYIKCLYEDKFLGKGFRKDILNCDGLVTQNNKLVLCIYTADCYPIFLYDPKKSVIALLHAGWRGTSLGILSKCIKIFLNEYDSKISNIIISFGPGISIKKYEVSKDFYSIFPSEAFQIIENRYYLDLKIANIIEAQNLGISKKQFLSKDSLCTASNLNILYSYRMEGKLSGRMISFISFNSL